MVASREAAAAAAHDDGHDLAAVPLDRGQEVEAAHPGIAGLDAVDALDAAEQLVVIGDAAAAEDELRVWK